MKVTLDLPARLISQLKRRALHEGRTLKDVGADVLRAGLDARPSSPKRKPVVIRKDKETGLPVIVGPRVRRSGKPLTPERMAQILIDQEAEWAIAAMRRES